MSGMRRAGAADGPVVGGEPRVELLPPVVAQRLRERAIRRVATLILVAVVIAVGAGYALATVRNTTAQAELLAAQAETTRLLSEQQKYIEVSVASTLVAEIQETRSLGTSTEVMWADVFVDIAGALPPGSFLSSTTFSGRAPWQPAAASGSPLTLPATASVNLTITTPTVPDVAGFLRALKKVTGYLDATASSVVGPGVYTTTLVLSLDESVLADRYPVGKPIADDEKPEVTTPTPTPTPSPTPTAEEGE